MTSNAMLCSTLTSTLLLAAVVTAKNSIDYCNVSRCGSQHIGCNNTGELSSSCPANAHKVNLKNFRKFITVLHNELRNKVAGGFMPPFLPAARMAEMDWDDELADLAQLNVNSCKLQSDQCHGAKRFHYSGQNIGLYRVKEKHEKLPDIWLIRNRVRAWMRGSNDTTMNEINKYPGNATSQILKHIRPFTVMIAEKNTHVGCGAVRYSHDNYDNFLFTCNYATNNLMGQPIYLAGKKPGSKCRSGRSVAHDNLCSLDEVYDTKSPIAV